MAVHLISDPVKCELLGDFGWFVQVILAVLSFSSLISKIYSVKRYLDFNRRTWRIWFMDASKQALSSAFTHFFNLIAALLIGSFSVDANPCTWYFLTMLIDAILGTVICFLLLLGIEQFLKPNSQLSFRSGFYGEPPEWKNWAYQASLWLMIVLLMKVTMIGVMIMIRVPLDWVGEAILSPLKPFPKVELIFVMVIVPIIVNGIMFWVTDSYLKFEEDERLPPLMKDSQKVPKYTNIE
jgi:hypothetical protein